MWTRARTRARTRLLGLLASTVLVAAASTACGDSSDARAQAGAGGSTPATSTLTVFAAASLTAAFTEIGKDFEDEHPGIHVDFSFAGSSDLVSQIQQGAPADVFASADTANMDKLTADGLQAGTPETFATNTLEIATPPGNQAGISSFADLADPDITTVVCAPQVPCGAATAQMESITKTTLTPVSEEQSVTDVLGKVISGEADAGVVYVTDVAAADGKVEGIPFPESSQVVNTYPIVATKDSAHADLADEFIDFVLSDAGRTVLTDAGFAHP